MAEELSNLVVEMEQEKVLEAVKKRTLAGEDPIVILDELRTGMTVVGDLFERGDYFLAELILAAEVFKAATAVLEPSLAKARPSRPLGKVLLATPKGDIHDLGKNILAVLLRAQGFEVYDLGVDVYPQVVVEKVKETMPDFVGFSVLITSAFDAMKETAAMLVEADIRKAIRLMVGGGVTTPLVRDYIGADFQTTDAIEGVRYCTEAMRGV